MHKEVEGVKLSDPEHSSWTRRILVEHPAFLVSGLYLVASLIGLVYSWAFLRAFGINVFRYAEMSDFLLASLIEPFTWVLAVLAVTLVLFDNAMSRRIQAGCPGRLIRWYGSERYRHVNYLVAVLLVIFYLLAFATMNERNIRDGEGEFVRVHLTDGSPPKQLIMLGTTVKYVFLYDHADERVDMHPHESILMITKSAPDSRKD